MRKIRTHKAIRVWLRQGLAGVLALTLMLSLLPTRTFQAQAANEQSWAMPYMEQLVDWGVMRGDIDGNLYPNRNITRAEFVTMINRAYGYTDVGPTPFIDISGKEWYADDIAIAYKVGYFQGVSANQAAPQSSLVREQAAMLLARNMMLQEKPGEVLDFTDGRSFSKWSRGMVQAITALGVITGYPDGTFRPQNKITRGEASAMLVRAIGELVNTPGEHKLGSVYGNVTINKSGVTLKDTVIVGNLYLTGGIGLGDVLLENVTVLGQIVVSGAGESNSAQSSIVMRNVEATEMIVDSINNQFVTVRAEGNTRIANTSVRTNGYVEDASTPGMGLSFIELNGEAGTKLQLAGNIKEAVNRTPNSSLVMAQGAADKITIDEHATGSTVTIDRGARIDELNLDVAAGVSGDGDIEKLNVGANGCTVTMLPDDISIRPGLTATIAGTSMDSATASEWSSDPRILAGYPRAKNVSSSSATLLFSTNKAGTVYWAVTALADGSLDTETVISPPKNVAKIVASGSLNAASAQKEYTAEIKKLTSDGSYYISAVMVDSRGNRSPLKVAAFGVPDETTPAFAKGYPRMSRTGTDVAQVTVMPNKSCQLYYALLPSGSTAPTGNDFKANAVTGNLGYGSVDVVKNVTQPINVNDVPLEEQASYDLYLWLTDYDGAKSSKVTKVTFTTADETPPVITEIMQTNSQAAAAEFTYVLNEPGTLYWAIVAEGNESFMNYDLDTTEAKVKVESGVGALKKGSSKASKADTDVRVNITGLNTKNTGTNSYTVYYIAKDAQGNYGERVGVLNVRTLDTTPPTVKLEFTSFSAGDSTMPRADTDLRLVFSESVRGGVKDDKLFLNLYNAVLSASSQTDKNRAREALAAALRAHITLYDTTNGKEQVPERDWTPGDPAYADTPWIIDWRYATVTMESSGRMVITLPTTEDWVNNPSALNLEAGASYRFELTNIYDNAISPWPLGDTALPFRTVYAEIELRENDTQSIELADGTQVRLDLCLDVKPTTTSKVAETERWDMIMWSNTSMELEVYRRDRTADTPWVQVGHSATITVNSGTDYSGISLRGDVIGTSGEQATFETLKYTLLQDHVYEYGLHFTKVGNLTENEYNSWGDFVKMYFSIIAGGANALSTVAGGVNSNYDSSVQANRVTPIGQDVKEGTKYLYLEHKFTDRSTPSFQPDSPKFTVGSSTLQMDLALTKSGTIYYVIAPAGDITTAPKSGYISTANDGSAYDATDDVAVGADGMTTRERAIRALTSSRQTYIPRSGTERERFANYIAYMPTTTEETNEAGETVTTVTPPINYSQPGYLDIVNPPSGWRSNRSVKVGPAGGLKYSGVALGETVSGLKPSTRDESGNLVPSMYYVYFVFQGNGEVYSSVECYRFTMGEVEVPNITVSGTGTGARIRTNKDANLYYVVADADSLRSYTNVFGQTITYGEGASAKSMSVLDALTGRPNGPTGPSYFDLYADSDLRADLADYIINHGASAGTSGQPTGWDSRENVAQDSTISWDVERYLTRDRVEYYVLAVGRHPLSNDDGDSYGFAAAGGIYKPDKKTPEYDGDTYLSATITQVRDSAGNVVTDPKVWQADPTSYRYTGTVTVNFRDNDVYLLINNKRYEVWAVSGTPSGSGSENAKGAVEMLGGDKNFFSIAAGNVKTYPTNSFTYTFRNLPHGATIRLFDGGDICNHDSWITTKKLTLRFDSTLTAIDYPGGKLETAQPGFYATWK